MFFECFSEAPKVLLSITSEKPHRHGTRKNIYHTVHTHYNERQ